MAAAKVGLAPGTKLYFVGGGSCSLGFLATNSDRDRLAVTAGHCADGTGQEVVSENRNPIGHVVSWLADDISNDLFGVTLISLYDNTYTSDAYFSSFGNPGVGDYVRKYGARTDKTEGRITSISSNPDRARDSIMYSTMVSLEGDSGASWVGADDDGGAKLLGLNIGHTVRSDGGYGKAYGFPIRALISLIQRGSDVWGPGFIPVGR